MHTKTTFVQCKIFLEGTPFRAVAFILRSAKHQAIQVDHDSTIMY